MDMEEFAAGRGEVRVYFRWYDTRGDTFEASDLVEIEIGESRELFELRIEEVLIQSVQRKGTPPPSGEVQIEHIEVIPNVPRI